MTEVDILATAFVTLLGWLAVTYFHRGSDLQESRLVGAGFAAHVLSAFAQVWLIYVVYGIGDQMMYMRYGGDLASAMRADFTVVFPEVLKLVLQQDYRLSVFVPVPGTPVATMCGLTSLGILLLGDSIVAVSVLFATAALLGKLALYKGLKLVFPERLHVWLLLGTLFVPSTVFWSAGILKEAIAMAGLGPMFYGLARLSTGSRSGWAPLVFGTVVVGIVKPYIIMAFAGAAGMAFYWIRSTRDGRVVVRPATLVLSMAAAIGATLLVSEFFPRYSIEGLVDETARLQAAGFSGSGGSNYQIGDPTIRTFAGQLTFAPFALITALYRPFIVEVRNPMMFVNALETTALLAATIWLFVRTRTRDILRSFVTYPGLAFCLAFVVLLGVPVGLTAANLGTLSRYRIPLVPFQFVLIIGVAATAAVARRAQTPALAKPAPLPGGAP
ncbi:MAG: hypothetical protein AAF602_28540 [Myxococcota bacterium]